MKGMSGGLQRMNSGILGKNSYWWRGGAGPALLLLHSAWGDAELSWSPVWNVLSRSFTVVAPDMPGFGRSDDSDVPSLTGRSRLLKGLLDHQEFDRVLVIGNSFGASLAIEFASRFPERVSHLVIVNGGYLPAIPRFVKGIIAALFLESVFRQLMRKAVYSEKAFAKAFPDRTLLSPGFFEVIRQCEERHSRAVFDALMQQTAPQQMPKTPATMIWGTGDRLMSMRQAESMRSWLGDPIFVPLVGAGHMPQVEQPEAFVAAIKKVGTGQ